MLTVCILLRAVPSFACAILHAAGKPFPLLASHALPACCPCRKFVKGYLSHQHKVAVLSKQEPFPPLSTIALSDP